MADKKTLKAEYDNLDGARSSFMARARECAALTHPSVLPDVGSSKDSDIEQAYMGLGTYGASNLTNKLTLTMYPVGVPWFQQQPSAKIRGNPNTTPESLEALEAILYMHDLLIRDQLEAARLRTRGRTSIEQIVVVGNTLSMMDDDYTIKTFRLDQYVQKRAASGLWLDIITHEMVDPRELTPEQLAKAGVSKDDLENRDFAEEPLHLFTKCSRQRGAGFVIRQELDDKVITESQEPISRYFPAGYVEIPGENYSRGFIEERLGGLRSLNGHHYAMYAVSVASSRVLWGIDTDRTSVTPRDLVKPTGSVVSGVRVVDGKWDGVACLKADKMDDMQVSFAVAKQLTDELSAQMLIESAVQPKGERVTAYQVNRIARELEGATGGIYSHIAEEMQTPLVKYTIWKMEKEHRLPPLPPALKGEINVEILTGLEAMGRQREAEKIDSLVPIMQLSPEIANRVNPDWLLLTKMRGLSIDTSAALKSDERLKSEAAEAAEIQAKMALAQQAISTGGAVVENAAKAQGAPSA